MSSGSSSSPTPRPDPKIKMYPPWVGPSQAPSPFVPPRSIPPLLPPSSTCPNELPHRPDPPLPPVGWTRIRHIIPAAYPRSFKESTGTLERSSSPFSTSLPKVGENETKEQRQERNLKEARKCIKRKFGAFPITHDAKGDWDGNQLWIAGECWSRDTSTTDGAGKREVGLTLVVSAANGFTKESWMPTIRRLLQPPPHPTCNTFGGTDVQLPRILPSGEIDQVWFLDDYHHGQSIDLNKGLIGDVHSWLDGGRDIINFVRHVLPPTLAANSTESDFPGELGSTGSSGSMDEMLPWHSQPSHRKVIGLGHSVGGNAMVRAAHLAPELFHALFLVEPMVPPIHHKIEMLDDPNWQTNFFRPIVTLRRRAAWGSMSEALAVRSSPFFSSWHDEIFKVWETHHLVPSQTHTRKEGGRVTLATPPWAEAAVFTEPTGLAEGWDALPHLQIPVGFLMAGDASSTMGEEITRELVSRPPLAANERLMDAGHLIVHEKPDEVADAIRRFLGSITIEKASSREKAKL